MSRSKQHVVIVGGGITGLAAAWFLQEAADTSDLPLTYTLLEQSNRWGGKILTDTVGTAEGDRFIVEAGPDSFITQKPWAFQLAHRLGLEDSFLPTNDERRGVFVLNDGRPTRLPDGVLLIVPTKLAPFALSPLISPLGKLRMGLDLFIPPRTDGEDETLAEFVTRRLGTEALDKIAEPLMSGIYNAEAERQSLLATFPRFRKIEEEHGSLIRGMVAARRRRASRPSPSTNGQRAPKPPSVFVSFTNGMEELVTRIRSRLSGDCRLQCGVARLEQKGSSYALQLGDGSCIKADAVILAVPSYVAATLVRPFAPQAADLLASIRYVSTGTVSLAYRGSTISHPLDGSGLVIPRSAGRPINAITWTSSKFKQRAPQDDVLLRVFFGGSRSPETMNLTDEALLSVVRRELEEMMGISAQPLFHRIYRWHRANPQYDVGHLQRVANIEDALPANLFVSGSPYRGIGIPDCVHQAQRTARQLIEGLRARSDLTTEARAV